jgi:hypothetical protein
MERANFGTDFGPRKQPALNHIQLFQFWKLSHRVRHCFIPVQIESGETVSVTCG